MKNDSYILGIGSVNIDIYGKSRKEITPYYDHISDVSANVGGVTYNILKNLSSLGANVKFITAVGDDLFADTILNKCCADGFDTDNAVRVRNCSSGIFMQVLDDRNDMYLAMTDMNALSHLSVDYLKSKIQIILNAKAIVCDPAVPVDCLEYITSLGVPVFIDPTSEALAEKMISICGGFYMIKPNQKELSVLTGMKTDNYQSMINACQYLCDKGVHSVCVSLGSEGCLYVDRNGTVLEKKLSPVEKMVNASGRGDAFFSAFISGYLNDESIETSLEYALAAGKLAVSSVSTINESLNLENIKELLAKENIK